MSSSFASRYIAGLDKGEFRTVLSGHLVPLKIVEWAHEEALPEDALDKFVDLRVELFIKHLAALLPNIPFRVFDSRQVAHAPPKAVNQS